MADEDLKRVLSPLMLRDIRSVEPDKTGYIAGDSIRIYTDAKAEGEYQVTFITGTDKRTKDQYAKKLEEGRIKFKVVKDFGI